MTPLDTAHAAMTAFPDDDSARLRFYARLADDEMFLLLQAEWDGETLTPQVFDLEDGPVVLIFDLEERLAGFVGAPAPYAALPGRVIAAQLAGQGVGLGINLGVAPSSLLLGSDAVDWLAATLTRSPELLEARAQAFHAPKGLPQVLLDGLDAKLARTGGLADFVLLAGVSYGDGRRGHMLAFVGASPGAEVPLARTAGEALTFSGVELGEMDVTFLAAGDPAVAAMARVALRFDLEKPKLAEPSSRKAPGMDPDTPPILR
ncbi:MAG: SseB family protein [Paracoccaceae bacterium]|nr:SseB family protein [Paracoccaceae bacterium]